MDLENGKELSMEGISPTLKLAMAVRQSLECGESVRNAVREYLMKNQDNAGRELSAWLAWQGGDQNQRTVRSPQRKVLFDLISRGLGGESILSQLAQLEEELSESAKIELERFSAALPLKALIPLLLLQFPALLILLFGPLLRQMLESF